MFEKPPDEERGAGVGDYPDQGRRHAAVEVRERRRGSRGGGWVGVRRGSEKWVRSGFAEGERRFEVDLADRAEEGGAVGLRVVWLEREANADELEGVGDEGGYDACGRY